MKKIKCLMLLVIVFCMFTVINVEAADMIISGHSAFRKSATEASVNFISNTAGTIYYTVNESSSAVIEDLEENGGSIASSETTTINIPAELLSSGAKYVHIAIKDDLNNYSNILTISMPHDVYYFEDFEAYNTDVYPEFFYLKHNGGNASNQKIVELDGDKFFQGYGTFGRGLDERIQINSLTTGYIIFEADILRTSMPTPTQWYFGGIVIGENYDNDTRNINTLVNNNADHKFSAAFDGERVGHTSNVIFETNTKYHMKLVVDVANGKYDYYIDGIKANSSYINAKPAYTKLDWFGIYSGDGTVYYDNMKFYSQSKNPNAHSITKGAETNGTFTIDKDEAIQGELVTITPSPSTGYRVKSVKINDSTDGITKNENNYTFTMLNEDVTVLVEFELVPSILTWTIGGIADEAMGTGGEATFGVAQRFTANDLVGYDGKKLVKVSFYTGNVEASYKIMIWDGGYYLDGNYYEGSLVYEHTPVTAGGNFELKEVDIDPIIIDASKELWIGYEVTTTSAYPVGIDNGPANEGKGDLIYFEGEWDTLTSMIDSNYNFALFGTVIDSEKHNITVSDLTNGTINIDVSEAASGETVTISPVVLEGYRVKSVKINDSTDGITQNENNYTFTMPDEDVVVLVEFERITKTITIREMQNGIVTANELIVPVGENVILTVTPNSGYKLNNISVLDMYDDMPVNIDSNYTFVMPNYNVFIYAEFGKKNSSGGGRAVPSYIIVVNKSRNGKISPKTRIVAENDDITFTITPDEGYEIDNVMVDEKPVGKVDTYIFKNVTKRHTIFATFKKIEKRPIVIEPKRYNDVLESDWYYDSIMYVTEKAIMEGSGDNLFNPKDKITRAMMVTVLYNLENKPAVLNNNSFNDVSDEMWYTPSIVWAKDNDIVKGFDDGKFEPEKEITREQLAVIMANYINYKNTEKPKDVSELDFVDSDEISFWAKDSVKLIKEMKIMQGKDNNLFDAFGFTSRAEAATLIMNFCENVD